MCGIAGYSLASDSRVDRRLAAQALLAAIAERGADAVGYAYRKGSEIVVRKRRGGAGAVLERVGVADGATQVLLHVRDYTKGHPSLEANNHPIRHGAVVGVHNGTIQNDDELMAAHGFTRAQHGMTVDSEVIFALADATGGRASALEQLRGSMAAAWLDERRSDFLYLARGTGRPLWLGRGPAEILFASTERALEIAERYAGVRLEKSEVAEGRLLTLAGGSLVASERFEPDRNFVEEELPSVRAPLEGMLAMQRLAAMYTTG